MYKLLALDVDGTILRTDRGLAQRTIAALARARSMGLEYTLVTGRQWAEARIIARRLDLRLPVVCQNGAHILEPGTGRELFHSTVDRAVSLALTEALERAGVVYYWYIDQEIWVPSWAYDLLMWGRRHRRRNLTQMRGWLRWLWESRVHLRIRPIDDMHTALVETPQLPTSATIWERAAEIVASLPEEVRARLDLIQNNERSHNIVTKGISKQQGLAFLAQRLGVERAQVIAVGDQYNDLPMLTWAGLGVAMGNAPAPIKERSHRVAPTNDEDGVAWLVEQLAAGQG